MGRRARTAAGRRLPFLAILVISCATGRAAEGVPRPTNVIVILVDEANTLPSRLIEELRLLTNVPTPMPSVHLVLAGTAALEEALGTPRMESIAQRIRLSICGDGLLDVIPRLSFQANFPYFLRRPDVPALKTRWSAPLSRRPSI